MPSSHAADRFDGGRAASEPEEFRTSELGWIVKAPTEPSDDDVRALALAIIALTSGGD